MPFVAVTRGDGCFNPYKTIEEDEEADEDRGAQSDAEGHEELFSFDTCDED